MADMSSERVSVQLTSTISHNAWCVGILWWDDPDAPLSVWILRVAVTVPVMGALVLIFVGRRTLGFCVLLVHLALCFLLLPRVVQ